MSVFKIAEIGINHNGDMNLVEQMIIKAKESGANAVKFQKRDLSSVYSESELQRERVSPFGKTNFDLKNQLELSIEDFKLIDNLCKKLDIDWFVSCWDLKSQVLMKQFNLKYNKVASPMLTNKELVEEIAKEKKHTFISTGMSTLDQIEKVVQIFKSFRCPFELMHCVSMYPTPEEKSNLNTIKTLRDKFNVNIGFSSHDLSRRTAIIAVTLGISSYEKHVTLDRNMFGSDQKVSVLFDEFKSISDDIDAVYSILGSENKFVAEEELPILNKLRRVDDI